MLSSLKGTAGDVSTRSRIWSRPLRGWCTSNSAVCLPVAAQLNGFLWLFFYLELNLYCSRAINGGCDIITVSVGKVLHIFSASGIQNVDFSASVVFKTLKKFLLSVFSSANSLTVKPDRMVAGQIEDTWIYREPSVFSELNNWNLLHFFLLFVQLTYFNLITVGIWWQWERVTDTRQPASTLAGNSAQAQMNVHICWFSVSSVSSLFWCSDRQTGSLYGVSSLLFVKAFCQSCFILGKSTASFQSAPAAGW